MPKRRKIEIAFVLGLALAISAIFAWSRITGRAVFSDTQKAPEAIRFER